jgi:hypothetical protein
MGANGSIKLTRAELYDRIWSKAMVQVAEELGISDVGLKKRCRKHAIPMPPRGYWRQVETGRSPRKPPLPRCPKGVSDTIRFSVPADPSSRKKLPPEATPFPRTVELPPEDAKLHPVAAALKAQLRRIPADDQGLKRAEVEDLPRVKVASKSIGKTCRCVHALITLLEENGVTIQEHEGNHPGAVFVKENEHVRLEIEEPVKSRLKPRKPSTDRFPTYSPPEYTYHPTGFLHFHIEGSRWGLAGQKNWNETPHQSLEWLVPDIAKRILEALPALIAAGIEEERRRQEYREEERRREHAKQIYAHQEAILQNLGRATYWWNRSQEIHAFLSALEEQWKADDPEGPSQEQTDWLKWARRHADALSPISGGYPNPEADGPVDYKTIPIGGPYPKPEALPEIPEPAPTTGSSSYEPLRQEYRYPFWLKYQRR